MERDFMAEASAHVIEHARYSNARIAPEKPYMVRWPLSSGQVLRSDDTMDLVRKVARKMKKQAAAARDD